MQKKFILLVILLTLPTLIPFFNIKFFYTQDYIFIARLNQMSQALLDGVFPVRWASDLRYGEPLFNFYAPLPYYLGVLIHLVGFDFIWVAKILFIISAILSAIFMYILAEKLFGKRGGIMAAILYTYAPYKAVDMYVRGSLSETWAFVFFPLIFYASFLLSQKVTPKKIILLSLSLAGLFLTHNVTTLMFLPFLFFWWVYLVLKEKKWEISLYLIGSFILGFALSSFFLLPALLETDLIQTKYLTVGYFNFRAHFVAIKQFFSLFWGYGSSLWGLDDGLSFQIGLANWIILLLGLILGVVERHNKKFLLLLSFLMISFTFSIFLQHNKSAFVWEAFPLMAFIQFPWRFLGISIFITSLVGAAITPYFKNRFTFIYFALIVLTIISTISYFRPKEYIEDNFFDKFLNKEKMQKGVDLTKDYLPIWVKNVDAPFFNSPVSERGKMEIISFEKKSTNASGRINVLTDSVIELPITYFPDWQVWANGKKINLEQPKENGLIRLKLTPGTYNINAEFKDTPIRIAGNFISLAALLFILLWNFKYKKEGFL